MPQVRLSRRWHGRSSVAGSRRSCPLSQQGQLLSGQEQPESGLGQAAGRGLPQSHAINGHPPLHELLVCVVRQERDLPPALEF